MKRKSVKMDANPAMDYHTEEAMTKEKCFELAVEAIVKLGYDRHDAESIVNEDGLDDEAAEMLEDGEPVEFSEGRINFFHKCLFNNGYLDGYYLQRQDDQWHEWEYLALDGAVFAYNSRNEYEEQREYDVDEFLEMCDRPDEDLTLDDFQGDEEAYVDWEVEVRRWNEFKEEVLRETKTIQ